MAARAVPALALLLALAIAGCATPPAGTPPAEEPAAQDAEASAAGSQSATATAAPLPEPEAAPQNRSPPAPAPAPPARLREAGMAWSGCEFRDTRVWFRQEWAGSRVPPQYRPLNVAGGNLGQAVLRVDRCAALSVGNQTFVPDASFALFGVLVQAPPSLEGPSGNLYVLDALSDAPEIVAQMAEATLNAANGTTRLAEDASEVDSAIASAAVQEYRPAEEPGNFTNQVRLHWVTPGGQACWADLEAVGEDTIQATVVLTGRGGDPATLSGPAQTVPGVAFHGAESGHLGAPICLPEAP